MDHDIEQLLSHHVPDLVKSAIPKAECLVRRQHRARRNTRVVGMAATCLFVCGTSWQLMNSASHGELIGRPGANSESLQEVREPEFLLAKQTKPANVEAPRWRLELGEVTESGNVPLVLNSTTAESSQAMVIGYVTPPQAVEIPVWQLAPEDQETFHNASYLAEWNVPTEL